MYFDASSVNESFFKRCIVAHCQHIISMQMKTLANVFSLYCAQCRHARMLGIFFFGNLNIFKMEEEPRDYLLNTEQKGIDVKFVLIVSAFPPLFIHVYPSNI